MDKSNIIARIDNRISKMNKMVMQIERNEQIIAQDFYNEIAFFQQLKKLIIGISENGRTITLDESQLERLSDCMLDAILYATNWDRKKDVEDYKLLLVDITRQMQIQK